MSSKNQLEFSPVLFDTLFGLIIFFNIDTVLEVTSAYHLVFYFFGVIIVAHWWLMFKSVDDYFQDEVTNSALDVAFGILYVVCLAFFVKFAGAFDYGNALLSLVALFALDLVWSVIWQYVGKWRTRDRKRIRLMESDLDRNINASGIALAVFATLFLMTPFLSAELFVTLFGISYLLYIALTFRKKIVEFKIF